MIYTPDNTHHRCWIVDMSTGKKVMNVTKIDTSAGSVEIRESHFVTATSYFDTIYAIPEVMPELFCCY